MKTLELVQGSPEWLEVRGRYRTASEASVMMGHGSITREELVRLRATGSDQEFSQWIQDVLFAKGHRIEAQARPIAEAIIGEELFPVTAVSDDGYLLASLDGLTMAEDIVWECKQWNEEKAKDVSAGKVPVSDIWQVIQQLVVTGAEKCLYMVTDGTTDRCVHTWFTLADSDRDSLLAHWKQFDADVEAYAHEHLPPEPVGRAPEDLPALRLTVTGEVTASNLDAFREHAIAVFDGISTELSTDEDFANAEKTVKWCKGVEEKLEGAKQSALEQTASIDELFRSLDAIKGEARAKRLELDRLVKSRKESIRADIIRKANDDLDAFIADLCEGIPVIGQTVEITVPVRFADALRGKRTVRSLNDAAADCLAKAKVVIAEVATRVSVNMNWYAESYHHDYHHLFRDIERLAHQEREAFQSIVTARVQQEEQRLQALAEAKQREREETQQPDRRPVHAAETLAMQSDPLPSSPPPATEPSPEPEPQTRPTDMQIVEALALHFRVHESKVLSWLLEMDLQAIEADVTKEFAA